MIVNYKIVSKNSFLKVSSFIFLALVCMVFLTSFHSVSANAAPSLTLKLYNDVGEPIHLRSNQIDGYWISNPAENVVPPPFTIKEREIVKLRASSYWYNFNSYPSGSFIYEAVNYGRTTGRVEILFGPLRHGEIKVSCFPEQRCRISNASKSFDKVFEVHIL